MKELLSAIDLFAPLNSDQLELLASLARVESYQTGTVLFREGERGERFYVIENGEIRISRDIPGIGEEALAILAKGSYFGEMSLFDGLARSTDATVHRSAELIVIEQRDLEELLFLNRDLAYNLLWNFVRTLSLRLRETNNKLLMLSVSSKF